MHLIGDWSVLGIGSDIVLVMLLRVLHGARRGKYRWAKKYKYVSGGRHRTIERARDTH